MEPQGSLILWPEAGLNNTYEFSPYLKENTILYHYKHHSVSPVEGNNHCLHCKSYLAHKYKMQSYWLLKQLVYTVTTWL
jgi:hypothetical protein